MKITLHTPFVQILLASTCLAGCATMPASQTFKAPKPGDDGVVIAESSVVSGVSTGNAADGRTDDCSGPGLGVKVDSSLSGSNFLFDKNGEPCDAAQTLFDGRSEANRRQTDPAITLNFQDNLGPIPAGNGLDDPNNLPSLKPLPAIRLKSELIGQEGIEPAAGNASQAAILANKAQAKIVDVVPTKPDPLVATLASWERQDSVYADRSTEANEAAERNIGNISKAVQNQREQENVAKLMATLRERERQVQEEQRRHEETLERAQKNREITTAARTEWQHKEQELQSNLETTQSRLAQIEDMNKRLNADKASKEKAYQAQIANLSNDLKAAEAQADTSRRELVLQAAAKIAEAEQLAHAAQLQEQDIKLREAARLKAEAETMMDRALAIKAGGNVVTGAAPQPAVPLALMETPIVLQANGKTLPEILDTILNLAAPQSGQWKGDWQLTPASQYILKEKWSLTAEAPVQQVLAQLQQQVRAAHGMALTFTQFGQSRLLVVTDVTPLSVETAPK